MNRRFPGAASLVENLDSKVLIVLRDGTHLVGTLRSFDQFSNIILENTVERRNIGNKCLDLPLGLFILRGDNIVLLGSVDETREKNEIELVEELPLNKQQLSETRERDWNFETKW